MVFRAGESCGAGDLLEWRVLAVYKCCHLLTVSILETRNINISKGIHFEIRISLITSRVWMVRTICHIPTWNFEIRF